MNSPEFPHVDVASQACAVCAHILDVRAEWRGGRVISVVYQHAAQDEPADHPAVPVDPLMVKAQPVCDFCLGPDPHWTMPARSFVYREQITPGDREGSRGGWGCCDGCAAYLRADNWRGLLAAALRRWTVHNAMTAAERPEVSRIQWDRWMQLRENIIGPLQPWDGRYDQTSDE